MIRIVGPIILYLYVNIMRNLQNPILIIKAPIVASVIKPSLPLAANNSTQAIATYPLPGPKS